MTKQTPLTDIRLCEIHSHYMEQVLELETLRYWEIYIYAQYSHVNPDIFIPSQIIRINKASI